MISLSQVKLKILIILMTENKYLMMQEQVRNHCDYQKSYGFYAQISLHENAQTNYPLLVYTIIIRHL